MLLFRYIHTSMTGMLKSFSPSHCTEMEERMTDLLTPLLAATPREWASDGGAGNIFRACHLPYSFCACDHLKVERSCLARAWTSHWILSFGELAVFRPVMCSQRTKVTCLLQATSGKPDILLFELSPPTSLVGRPLLRQIENPS